MSGRALGPGELTTRAVDASDARGLAALFEAAGSPCFCRFWHFSGDNNAWLDRCANAPGTNRAELEDALALGTPEGRGVVACVAREVVGWMKVAPREVMHKFYDRRFYRKLPCFEGDRTGVWAIGCALVHPSWRRRGVASALLGAAVRLAPSWGARALEALPRRPREAVSDEELFTGPAEIFVAHGFEEVNRFEPYPVFRKLLAPASEAPAR